jgi:hypothetical protein
LIVLTSVEKLVNWRVTGIESGGAPPRSTATTLILHVVGVDVVFVR